MYSTPQTMYNDTIKQGEIMNRTQFETAIKVKVDDHFWENTAEPVVHCHPIFVNHITDPQIFTRVGLLWEIGGRGIFRELSHVALAIRNRYIAISDLQQKQAEMDSQVRQLQAQIEALHNSAYINDPQIEKAYNAIPKDYA